MKITDKVSVSSKVWWVMAFAILTGMIPIGAVFFNSAPSSWYWSDLNSDVKILIIVLGFIILIYTSIIFIGMKSKIIIKGNKNEIQARIEPFMRQNRVVPLNEIDEIRIRKFNAIGNFGGIGYRKNFGKMTAYIMSFSGIALEMKLADGKSLNVEITKEDEWTKYLEQIKQDNFA